MFLHLLEQNKAPELIEYIVNDRMELKSVSINNFTLRAYNEIEAGFHYTRYPSIWKAIYQAAESSKTQVLATTHSYECVQGATEGILDDEAFSYIRRDREDVDVKAKYHGGLLLKAALDADMEVR